ncbi:MAG: biotin transporter BioY [Eubacteriales bacterium]|nr:biotin transporter BioY [Eubacteriales bacterium]
MEKKTVLLTYSALMCALIIVSTLWFKFSIPGTDVLVTLQVFFILLCGLLLPVKYCFYAIGAYLFIGLMGAPVFSSISGPAVLAMPTFGYLLGFPFAAATISMLRKKWGNLPGHDLIAVGGGIVVQYTIALCYIAVLKGIFLGAPVPFSVLLTSYCLAFLPLDIAKGVLAALLAGRLRKALKLV